MRLLISLLLVLTNAFSFSHKAWADTFIPTLSNEAFRNKIIAFVENQTLQQRHKPTSFFFALDKLLNTTYQTASWDVSIACYQHGRLRSSGHSTNQSMHRALNESLSEMNLNDIETNPCIFVVDLAYYPDRHYRFISFEHKGLELVGNRVTVRKLTLDAIKQQVNASISYILHTMNPDYHGFYKFYDAGQDKGETNLRTIYSASALFTFIKAHALFPNPELEALFKPIARFILSQQLQSGPNKGAFYYRFNPNTQQSEKKLVVGTASKTIFTLLLLNDLYPEDNTYLNAARLAGNWLINQVALNGTITPIQTFKEGKWVKESKQSLLYSGQVLSALSRLYTVTHDPRYLKAAKPIALRFLKQGREFGPIMGDDYRPKNSISSSWVLMALMDFTRASNSNAYLPLIEEIAEAIRLRQITNLEDVYYVGKFADAMTTSGNGWLNEVFGVYYPFCNDFKLKQCEAFKESMILSSRWLLQNAYRTDNTYQVKNPKAAVGGFMLNFNNQLVRTDAVCHGVNSFLSLYQIATDAPQPLIELKEQPLFKILPLIRAGNRNTFDFRCPSQPSS